MTSLQDDMAQSMQRAIDLGQFLDAIAGPKVDWIDRGAQQTVAETPTTTRRERVGHRARTIARLIVRDGDDCCYCRKPLGDDMTLEHVLAQSQGGTDDMLNLKLAHYRCNARMADLPPHAKEAAAKAISEASA